MPNDFQTHFLPSVFFFELICFCFNHRLIFFCANFSCSVINQYYDPGLMDKEYVMKGNAAILKCSIPSFVADFVHVVAWVDDDGKEYVASDNFTGSKNINRLEISSVFSSHHFPISFYTFVIWVKFL